MSYSDANFDEKFDFLQKTLHSAIEKLLVVARQKKVLDPPYGRPATPTPFITEEEAKKVTLLDEDDAPVFKYDYGFNPLLFLSSLLQQAHPTTIAAHRQRRSDAFAYLMRRAAHANATITTAASLKETALRLATGIIYVTTTPIDSSTVMVLVQAVKEGFVSIDYSPDADFATPVNVVVETGPNYAVTTTLTTLPPATYIYIRATLTTTDQAPTDEIVNYSHCGFWTLPATANPTPVDIYSYATQFPCPPVAPPPSDVDAPIPCINVLVGDVFTPKYADTAANHKRGITKLLLHSPFYKELTSVLLAWHDTRSSSRTALQGEEVVYKQYRYDVKKYEKRVKDRAEKEKKGITSSKPLPPPPALVRPPSTPAFETLTESLPLPIIEESSRTFYRALSITPLCLVLLFDVRYYYYSKDMLRMVKESIRKSNATIRLFYSGCPLKATSSNSNTAAGAEPVITTTNSAEFSSSHSSSRRAKAIAESVGVGTDEFGYSKSSLQHLLLQLYMDMYKGDTVVEEQEKEEEEDAPLDEEAEEPQVLSLEPSVPAIDISGGIVVVNNSEGAQTEVFGYEFEENKVFCVEISLGTGVAATPASTAEAAIADVEVEATVETEQPRAKSPAEEENAGDDKEEDVGGDDASVDGSVEVQQISRMRTDSNGEDYFLKAQKTLFSTNEVVFVRSRVLVDGKVHVIISNRNNDVLWERMLVSELVATV